MTKRSYKKKNTSKRTKKYKSNRKIKSGKNNTRKSKVNNNHRGGFNCKMATIKEPGFSISAIGDVPGLSISESRGAIYRPDCKTDTNQAMVP